MYRCCFGLDIDIENDIDIISSVSLVDQIDTDTNWLFPILSRVLII